MITLALHLTIIKPLIFVDVEYVFLLFIFSMGCRLSIGYGIGQWCIQEFLQRGHEYDITSILSFKCFSIYFQNLGNISQYNPPPLHRFAPDVCDNINYSITVI